MIIQTFATRDLKLKVRKYFDVIPNPGLQSFRLCLRMHIRLFADVRPRLADFDLTQVPLQLVLQKFSV
jgi:hypothetical protein